MIGVYHHISVSTTEFYTRSLVSTIQCNDTLTKAGLVCCREVVGGQRHPYAKKALTQIGNVQGENRDGLLAIGYVMI